MKKNIEDFNTGVALIFGKLYDNFPKAMQLNTSEFPKVEYSDDDPITVEKVGRFNEEYEIYFHTAYFLLEEGYIRGDRAEGFIYISNCTLTSKGLKVLQRIPDSLQGKKNTVGDFLIEISRDGIKNITKESVKCAVQTILSLS